MTHANECFATRQYRVLLCSPAAASRARVTERHAHVGERPVVVSRQVGVNAAADTARNMGRAGVGWAPCGHADFYG